ncbi:MAG: hypothetical protein M9904_02455 [Chitinophagaceae bacterium]|nr:hypothetical protein [Chitinophagaceae bacterium]
MKTFPGAEKLTPDELKVVERLKGVERSSVFGIMIGNVMARPHPVIIRQLIADIKSQCEDAPEVVCEMLGFKTFLSIVKL